MRYAATDILSALSAPVGELDALELRRETKHDLVALVKSFWAIRFGKVAQLSAIEASDIQVICNTTLQCKQEWKLAHGNQECEILLTCCEACNFLPRPICCLQYQLCFVAWLQAIEKFWADVLDDTVVAKNYHQAMCHAANSNYEGVCSALGNVCVPLDKTSGQHFN